MTTRRDFLALAAGLGASGLWAGTAAKPSTMAWRENRALFAEGVASGDPDHHSVILWTRRPFDGATGTLHVEVAEDEAFRRVVARSTVEVTPQAGWTCRVLVGGLKPSTSYWYRFAGNDGNGSRIGRTSTAPAPGDARPAKFAFVSCQNVNMGYLRAWRRMIHDDRTAKQPIAFVVHLGDFIYEIIFNPSENPNGYGGNPLRAMPPYPHGEKVQGDRWIPTTVTDYRVCYQHYLSDPDLQDARARWPFICMWDNHEFSQNGWQSFQQFGGKTYPAQTRKVAAMQAWFEFVPARILRDGRYDPGFTPPKVTDAPVTAFGAGGLGLETNNLLAINSLKGYRRQHWGANFELIITDQRSYRAEDPQEKTPDSFNPPAFRGAVPQGVLEVLDAGREHPDAPDTITVFGKPEKNIRKHSEAYTLLGLEQRAWFLDTLKTSKAPWKIWATSQATLDERADFQNLPADYPAKWAADDFGVGDSDYGTAYHERAVIYDCVRDHKVTGFVAISGDRHTFLAGRASAKLPPAGFAPVGISFTGGSISTPSPMDGWRHMKPDAPMRSLLLGPGDPAKAAPLANMLYTHGVRACLEFNRTGDVQKAKALSNPDLAPQLNFLDLEGHGYALVTAGPRELDCEFVCIPQPLAPSDAADGGAVRYRVLHSVPLWQPGETPRLDQRMLEGEAPFSV
jgi:alkaline phosphatase D